MKEEKRNKRQHKSWVITDSYSEVLIRQKSKKTENNDVRNQTERGETPLTLAVVNGDTDRVIELLNAGVSVCDVNVSGCSPLALSIYTKQSKIVPLLKKHGAELVTKKDISLINDVLSDLDEDLLDYALKSGCDVNFCDPKGRLPLVMAMESINIRKVNLLLNYQADISKCDMNSVCPLKQAVDTCNVYRKATFHDIELLKLYENTLEISEILLKKARLITTDYIIEAISANNTLLIKKLLFYVSAVDPSVYTDYHRIVKNTSKSTEIFDTLIDAGVDIINMKDRNGKLALCEAVAMGNEYVFESLIQMGANGNTTDGANQTAFAIALLQKDKFSFAKRMVLEGNINLEHQLSICFKKLSVRRFEYLLKLGADPFKRLENEQTVITDIAVFLLLRHSPLGFNDHTFLFTGKWKALLRECGLMTCHPENENKLFYDLLTCKSFKKALAKYNAPFDEAFQTNRQAIQRYAHYMLNTIVQLLKLGTVVPSYDIFNKVHCEETECMCDFLKKDLGLEDMYNDKSLYHGVLIEPVSLQMQCRTAVRRAMRTSCVNKTKCLPLPDSIKKFLIFDGEILVLEDLFDLEKR